MSENISDGIINVYKEKGYTSHDVVAIIKKMTHLKTGHTGTLDPNAEGVLPVCLGRATKLSDYIAAEIKQYTATVAFGTATDTQDSSGAVIQTKPLIAAKEEAERAIMSFVGDYLQTPPMYSALKVGGKKLYELARQGKEVERKSRLIHIYDIKILKFDYPDSAEIAVTCSKGTYIRTLCADIGERCLCAAHMGDLLRTKTGNFELSQSKKLSEIKEAVEAGRLGEIIIPMGNALSGLAKVTVSAEADKLLYNGARVDLKFVNSQSELADGEKILAYDKNESLVGIYIVCLDGKYIKPATMLL